MIWGSFIGTRVLNLHILEGNYNSERYIKLLERGLLPSYSKELTFMQDIASIHRSKQTKKWLQDKTIISMFSSGQQTVLILIQ